MRLFESCVLLESSGRFGIGMGMGAFMNRSLSEGGP